MRRISLLCGIAVLLGFAGGLHAQVFGEIAGDVRDPSGSIIAGSDVKIVNKATGAERTTVTNNAGLYSFPALPPGVYDVTATRAGFQSVTRTDLQLQVQQTARVDFSLPIGQSTQTVEVTAGAPLLTTENATVGAVIENRRIVELPLNGRNFLSLVALTPNVSAGFNDNVQTSLRQGGQRAQQNISVAGQRSEFNHFTLDGIENTDPNFNTYVFLPSIDALQEFKVQTGIYPAEFGRALGQINVSTKSGGNNFHGALFEFLRNDKLDAKDYAFTGARPPKNPFKWNQYGFTLGGPVWIPKLYDGKNRLFFFSNFEGYRDRKRLQGFYNVPYAAMRTGDFSSVPNAIFDPTTRVQSGGKITAVPFPNGRIPANRLDPRAVKLLEFIPAPNVNTGSFSSNFQGGDPRVIDKDQFTQRIDFVESSKSNWYGRYSRSSEFQSQLLLGRTTGNKVITEPRQAMISNSRVFTPTMVNEFRFSHTGFSNNLTTPLAGVRDVLSEVQIPGFVASLPSTWGIPQMQINPFSTFGDNSDGGPYVNNDHTFQVVDNFSWTRGKHSLRFGMEFRRDRYNIIGQAFARGSVTVTGIATEDPSRPLGYSAGSGTSFADFMLGYVQQSSVAVGVGFGQFRSSIQNYYIDDTWRIHPKVTISVGLRYENSPPYYDQSGKFANVLWPMKIPQGMVNPADPALHPALVRIGSGDFYQDLNLRFNSAIRVLRGGQMGSRGVDSDNNDFAPRLGIAWSPTDKWTMRAGIGAFYVQDVAGIYLDVARNVAGSRVANTNTSFPNLTLGNPFGVADPNAPAVVSTPKILGIEQHRRTPYNIQFMFNLQRQFGADTVLEAGYLGTESHKLWAWQPINEPYPSATGSPQSKAPYPELSPSSWVMSGTANSNYHSLSAKLTHRVGQGLTLMASYTFSKAIDLSSGARPHAGDQQFPQTTFCLQCERGLSIFNAAQRLVTSTLYELPFGKGKAYLSGNKFANVIAGGWQVSSILTLQSGLPATVVNGYDAPNYGQTVSRPNATGISPNLPRGQQDPENFFNRAAFARPTTGTFGNVGRNTLIGPGLINWDFSAIKNFQVREGQTLQFRAEFFNLPNHPNWAFVPNNSNPSTTLVDPNFGKIRNTRTDMRDIQLGLKYIF